MTIDRAQEILNGNGNVGVLSKGIPVWLEAVNEDTLMVTARYLDTNQVVDIPVSSLTDTKADWVKPGM